MSKQNEIDTKQAVTKEEWLQICKQEDKWCEFEEVAGMNRLQAEGYIKSMPVWAPMQRE